jgi:urease accessory protein
VGEVTLVADTYLGRISEIDLSGTHDGEDTDVTAEPVHVLVDDTDRRRSRFRTTSVDGRDVGITVSRTLRDGDVLDADGTPVVVELEEIPVLAVSLGALDPSEAVAFGHALGNRHRDLTVQDGRALVPIPAAIENPEAELRIELPPGVPVDRTTVPPSVFDDDHAGHEPAAGTETNGSAPPEHRHPDGQHRGHHHGQAKGDTGGTAHTHEHDHDGSSGRHPGEEP